ncbi:PREDICTED: follistatin-like [Tinamus guttatus]|uniref:follistatin-like n=1 Tax=Tinamus guttatus TaxID=94827 RepID=UPI00052EDCC4|nr:PREDICTED: follistatin-like [Tinamus guttatus]
MSKKKPLGVWGFPGRIPGKTISFWIHLQPEEGPAGPSENETKKGLNGVDFVSGLKKVPELLRQKVAVDSSPLSTPTIHYYTGDFLANRKFQILESRCILVWSNLGPKTQGHIKNVNVGYLLYKNSNNGVRKTCENVDCGPGKKCKMNKKNKPRCVCAPDCSNITWKGPVCGLDGKTYRNECALLKARCKEQPELEVQYQGKCKKTCKDVLCPGSSTCVVDQTNNAYCVTCNRNCPEPTSPEQYLCGNDGITYASACHLRKATCLLGRSIGLAYEGKCIKAKSCEDIQCSAGKKCLWDFKVGRGRCALCDELCPESKSDEAVCASDNTTYPSECAMKEAACSMGVLLEVKHSGSCNSINEDPEEEEEDEDQDYSFPISSILEW